MASDWPQVSLGSVTTWLSGGTPHKGTPAYWGGDIPWISANSMYGTRFNDSDLKITETGLLSGSRLAPRNSVLLLVRGGALHSRLPVGMACRDMAFNQDVKALVAKTDQLDSWFLLYWLMGHEQLLLDEIVEETGIGAGKLDTKRMQALTISLPPLNEQRSIVAIARSIDDKIDLNHRINQTLEAMAQAIFKSWFVDFDPVKAKIAAIEQGQDPLRAAMRAISGKTDAELDQMPREHHDQLAATAALFPDAMEESELGEIPKGWEEKSLDKIASYLNGLALQKFPPESEDEYLPVIKIAQLRAGYASGADRASKNIKPEYIVQDGDVLFSWSGSLEVDVWTGGVGALNQHLFKVTSEHAPKWFCYFATKHYLLHFREIAANKATTMGHIQRKHLSEAKIAIPPADVIKAATEIIDPIFRKMIEVRLQSNQLAQLRDTLLPKLLSGELSVQAIHEDVTA